MHTTNDAALLDLLAQDPQAGLAAVLDAYGGMINAIVRRVLPDAAEDAEECVADVLVAAWRSAPQLAAGHHSLKGWLCVTARNTAISRWRSLRRRQAVPLDEALDGDWLLSPQPTDAEQTIQALVDAMDEPDRTIFIRRYYLLEPSREIAQALGMQEHNVNVRLSRGRERLRRQFTALQKEETRYANAL